MLLMFTMLASPACSGALDGTAEGEPTSATGEDGSNAQRGQGPFDPTGPRTAVLPSEEPPSDAPPGDDPPADDPPVDDPPVDDPPVDDPPLCGASGDTCYDTATCCAGFCTYLGMDYIPGFCSAQVADGGSCETDTWCLSGHCTDSVCEVSDCAGLAKGCWSKSDCCGDLFCSEGGGYVPGSCTPPQPDGAACWWHDWCQSGVCTDGICTSGSCGNNGEGCYESDECCTGLCTYDMNNPYIPGACFSAQPDDSTCLDASWCQSGVCTDGQCGYKTCEDAGTECWGDGYCCHGFCTYTGASGYTPGVCAPLQDLDTFCLADTWCKSGHCADGTCQSAECLALDSQCYSASECCSGMCTYDGQGYVQGSCVAPQPAGAACVADMWCESTSCVDGACQDLSDVSLTFGEVYHLVFEFNGCAGGYCHSDPFGGLNFQSEDQAYGSLVNAPVWQPWCDTEHYVVPGDPEASLLWLKVRPYSADDPWCGDKMPLGTMGLPAADAALVEAWIAQGALP